MTPEIPRPQDAPVVHVVEDDASSAQATARVLRAAGLDVRLYASAAQLLADLPSGHGCIVLDLSLPEVSGLELQDRLSAHEGMPPVVFLTGHGDVPLTARAMKAGAIDFLTKPIEASALLEAVDRALAQTARRAPCWRAGAPPAPGTSD